MQEETGTTLALYLCQHHHQTPHMPFEFLQGSRRGPQSHCLLPLAPLPFVLPLHSLPHSVWCCLFVWLGKFFKKPKVSNAIMYYHFRVSLAPDRREREDSVCAWGVGWGGGG